MSEPRILTPTDRAECRARWWDREPGGRPADPRVDIEALLDTCDAMQAVIRRQRDGWVPGPPNGDADRRWFRMERSTGPDRSIHSAEPMSSAEAAVLDTTRQDRT